MANSKTRGVSYEDPSIVGGTVDNTPVGATTASTGAFTTLTASGATTLNGSVAIGDATGDLIGFHGATGVAQATFVATVSINALSVSGVIGYTTSASFSAHATAINSILACLIAKGIMAAS